MLLFVCASLRSVCCLCLCVSLGGKANLLLFTTARGIHADRQEEYDTWEKQRTIFITKAAERLAAKQHVLRFSLATAYHNGSRNKATAGRMAVGRCTSTVPTNTRPRLIPTPRSAHNYTAVWPHKGSREIEMDDFWEKESERERK